MQVYFAESLERLPENLKQVRPTIFFAVPRVWEKFKAKLEEGLQKQPPLQQRLFSTLRKVAFERHSRLQAGLRVSYLTEGLYQAAKASLLGMLRRKLGLERTHIFASAAAPIGRDVLDFFLSIDVPIMEVYGQSEVTGPTSLNTHSAVRQGTLGRPMMGVEVKIAQDGEILVRGGNVCAGYFKNEEATKELLEDDWLHSGDVGQLDGEGYLKITGRKKEIIVTSGGKKTAPANIEAMLKSISPVGNAVVIGERRNYLTALLTLDPDKLPALAKQRTLPGDAKEAAKDPRFIEYLRGQIEAEVNPKLSRFETIKKFAVLPEDFTVAGGELTPSLKVKRAAVEKKYASVIDGLYEEKASAQVA
jgi:long-chain acyl-CoA synthetase